MKTTKREIDFAELLFGESDRNPQISSFSIFRIISRRRLVQMRNRVVTQLHAIGINKLGNATAEDTIEQEWASDAGHRDTGAFSARQQLGGYEPWWYGGKQERKGERLKAQFLLRRGLRLVLMSLQAKGRKPKQYSTRSAFLERWPFG